MGHRVLAGQMKRQAKKETRVRVGEEENNSVLQSQFGRLLQEIKEVVREEVIASVMSPPFIEAVVGGIAKNSADRKDGGKSSSLRSSLCSCHNSDLMGHTDRTSELGVSSIQDLLSRLIQKVDSLDSNVNETKAKLDRVLCQSPSVQGTIVPVDSTGQISPAAHYDTIPSHQTTTYVGTVKENQDKTQFETAGPLAESEASRYGLDQVQSKTSRSVGVAGNGDGRSYAEDAAPRLDRPGGIPSYDSTENSPSERFPVFSPVTMADVTSTHSVPLSVAFPSVNEDSYLKTSAPKEPLQGEVKKGDNIANTGHLPDPGNGTPPPKIQMQMGSSPGIIAATDLHIGDPTPSPEISAIALKPETFSSTPFNTKRKRGDAEGAQQEAPLFRLNTLVEQSMREFNELRMLASAQKASYGKSSQRLGRLTSQWDGIDAVNPT